MGKAWHAIFPAKSTIKQHVQWCTWQPFLTTNNVRDFHQVIINDVCKVISWQFVCAFEQNFIIKDICLDANITTNHIIDMNFLTWFYLETNNILLSILYQTFNLLHRHRQGVTHLQTSMRIILEVFNFLTLRIQLLWCIKSNICLTSF